MPDPLHLPPPGPAGAPRDRRAPDDDVDLPEGVGSALDDLDDPSDDDAFDGDWPDDEPLPDAWDPSPPSADALDPLDDGVDDEADDDLVLDDPEPEDLVDDLLDEPLVLPWRTVATVDDRELPAILDPTAARTRWIGGRAGRARIVLHGIALELDVDRDEDVDGDEALRIGRDVLSGRVIVAS